jgi:hypothetical protein
MAACRCVRMSWRSWRPSPPSTSSHPRWIRRASTFLSSFSSMNMPGCPGRGCARGSATGSLRAGRAASSSTATIRGRCRACSALRRRAASRGRTVSTTEARSGSCSGGCSQALGDADREPDQTRVEQDHDHERSPEGRAAAVAVIEDQAPDFAHAPQVRGQQEHKSQDQRGTAHSGRVPRAQDYPRRVVVG